MILLVHMLFGAAVGSLAKSLPLAIIFAFLSHYLLDLVPHTDYYLKDTDKKWGILRSNAVKISSDIFGGVILIFLFSKSLLVFYIYAFCAILPDFLTIVNLFFPNKILKLHDYLHHDIIHFLKDNKKISLFWRISNQIAVVIISILLLLSSSLKIL